MYLRIAAIVEGHGNREAVPMLIRRVAACIDPSIYLHIHPVLRVSGPKLRRAGEVERVVGLAAKTVAPDAAVIILVDCDDGCPALEAPGLMARARSVRPDLITTVVLAKREFEGWFLAAAKSLRGCRGLSETLEPPPDPEGIRDAKGWLTDHMPPGRIYRETEHQAALSARFDLGAARNAPSFDKCYREIERLVRQRRQR